MILGVPVKPVAVPVKEPTKLEAVTIPLKLPLVPVILPIKEVAETEPKTSNLLVITEVPIPTFPISL